jgi:hypothetical protein
MTSPKKTLFQRPVCCLLLLLCALATSLLHAQDSAKPLLSLDAVMSKADQDRTGVSKLSLKERAALEQWLTDFAITVATKTAADAALSPKAAAYAGIGQKHWVKSKADGGAFIQLEDGSLWEVSPIDKINTMLWLPLDDVVVVQSKNPLYPYKLVGERDAAEAKLVTSSRSGSATEAHDGNIELFASTGSAVAYVSPENDMTIYLWAGTACGYLDDENIYGFNGKHLGWFRDGLVYDHAGRLIAATAENFREPVKAAPVKGLKKLRPLKGLKELKPLKPLFVKAWSETPAEAFFLLGSR